MDLEGRLQARLGAVDLAAAVVREDDGGDLVLNSESGVLNAADALDNNGEVGPPRELLVVLPLKWEDFC